MNGLEEVFKDAVDFFLASFSTHILASLIPAFFLAGAIAVFISREAVLKYFGPQAKKLLSYGVAIIAGMALTV
jgi:uncharacterized membrane protein YraQ (UPF0718 family)